jgi:hypothetical protein
MIGARDVHNQRPGAQLRSGLLTASGLPRMWTALRRRPLTTAAHNRLDAGKTDADAHSPLENRRTNAGFPHRQQAQRLTGVFVSGN